MKRLLLSCVAALAIAPSLGHGAQDRYEIFGITNNPVIDAVNVINHGQLTVASDFPFESYSTLNWENHGIMLGSVGFRFETTDPIFDSRRMGSSFINFNPGVIQALDPVGFAPNTPCFPALVGPSYLLVNATNIITGAGVPALGASLIVGANGWLQLAGSEVDVSNSGLEVTPVWNQANSTSFSAGTRTNFTPDIAISDIYWVQDFYSDDFTLNTAGLWNGFLASSPGVPGPPGGPSQPGPTTPFTLFAPVADSYVVFANPFTMILTNYTGSPTNVTGTNLIMVNASSNVFKGAVFASAPADFTIQTAFLPSDQPGLPPNYFMDASVLFTVDITNVVTGMDEPAYIWVSDELASDQRYRGVSMNEIGCLGVTFKPQNYWMDRVGIISGGSGNNGYPDPAFYLSTGFGMGSTNLGADTVTNAIVAAGDFAAYQAFADNIVSRPPAVQGGNETNYPGRVRLFADNLNLENTRIRGEGQIFIQSQHLVATHGAVLDCENISFSLSSTGAPVNIESVVPNTVERLRGPVLLWSAVWTNSAIIVWTNNFAFTNVPIPDSTGTNFTTNVWAILDPVTNNILIGMHATMVNGDQLQTILPVSTYVVQSDARDVIINDDLSVVRSFKLSGTSFTLNSQLTFPGSYPPDPVTGMFPPDLALANWDASVAPNLKYFTNYGILTVANEIHLGDDRSSPYGAIVNTGTVSAVSITLDSSYIENRGSIVAGAGLFFQGHTAKMERGSSTSFGISQFSMNNVKFNQYQVIADGPLIFNVNDDLSDSGSASGNLFQLGDGFRMMSKPQTGDLLGSRMNSVAPATPSVAINHFWAGEDRGPSIAGFVNNAAVGTLALRSDSPNPSFRFFSASAQNAIYVDVLDLSLLPNYANRITIAPNFRIYFASALLGFTPPPNGDGVPQTPEEYLDGQFGGRLRWVKTYAGPNSSRPVIVNGQTVEVNRALADSRIIDSDGDGVANFFDGQGPNGDAFVAAPVVVQTVGNGRVFPDLNGQVLLVGETYAMMAVPNDGSEFIGWSGSLSSDEPDLMFVMQSNLTFTASFTFNPVAAAYSGLFYEEDDVRFQRSGGFYAKTSSQGSYSAQLRIGGDRYSMRGEIGDDAMDTQVIQRSGSPPLTVHLLFGADQITGTVSDGSWSALLVADRAVTKDEPSPELGNYTMVLAGGNGGTNEPFGDSYGSVKVNKSGKAKIKGVLADGEKLSVSSALSVQGTLPVFAPLYSGEGQLLSWLNFDDQIDSDFSGLVSWIKQPDAGAQYYPAGFDLQSTAVGSFYNGSVIPATGFSDGYVQLVGGDLESALYGPFAVDERNRLTGLGDNPLKLKVNSSGLFKGVISDPNSGKPVRFGGALLQKQSVGSGNFLGTDESGRVLLRD